MKGLSIVISVIGIAFTFSLVTSSIASDEALAEKKRQAEERLKRESDKHRKSCPYVIVGMTKEEVQDIMGGKPDYDAGPYIEYGKKDTITISFNGAGGVDGVENCKRP